MIPGPKWSVTQWLYVFQGMMVSLGALLLGIGQGSFVLPTVSVFAAVTSVCYTDFLGWFYLNRKIANVVAVLAVLYAVIEFVGGDREKQLVSVANLLVYLQIVLMYQEKSERVFLEVTMLSLLQVVVASALSLGLEFGLLLTAYMFSVVATMTFFGVHRERHRESLRGTGVVSNAVKPAETRRTGRQLIELVDGPASVGVFQFRPLFWQTSRLALITMLASILLFFLLPRRGESVWQAPGEAFSRITGFSQEGVSLNEMARLRESDAMVFRVSFRDGSTDSTIAIAGEPYFSGMVLAEYSRGRWNRFPAMHSSEMLLPTAKSNQNVILQDFTIAPTNETTLFSVYPSFRVPDTNRNVYYRESEQRLFCGEIIGGNFNEVSPPNPFQYTVATTGIRNSIVRSVFPPTPLRTNPNRVFNEMRRLLQMPRYDSDRGSDSLGQLRATAKKVLEDAGVSEANDYRKAMALEAYFHTPGLFTYSLDVDATKRNPNIDPIEDFVSNHRTGHCELFASALVLMCRSQGVPARLVVGYRGGEYNKLSNQYTVRQLHAHAWVEVVLEPKDFPRGSMGSGEEGAVSAYLRLEPTPSAGIEEAEGMATGVLTTVKEFVGYLQTLWADYVLGLNSERQREAIYGPMRERIGRWYAWLFDAKGWSLYWQDLKAWMGWEQGDVRTLMTWRTGLVTTVSALTIFMFILALRGLVQALWRVRSHRVKGPSRTTVPFYAKLEKILARHGLHRSTGQTQREFAESLKRHLAARPCAESLVSLPARVVDAFYRVRFGSAPLDKEEAVELEQAMGALDAALAISPPK